MSVETDLPGASGLETALGYRRTDWAPGKGVFELDLDERHLNVGDMVHGGVYATMIDDATGYACCCNSADGAYKPSATLSLSVSFIGAPTTKRIVATGWRTGGGGTTSFAKAEVRDAAGTLLATGEAVYRHFKAR